MEQIAFWGKLSIPYRSRERVNLTIQQSANDWLAGHPDVEITVRHLTVDPDGFLTIAIMYKSDEPEKASQ